MQVETFHPVAWLAWLAAAALPALTTRNPLYLALVLLAAGTDFIALGQRSETAQGWAALVRLGALLWLLTIPFTMLTNHYGQIVLFTLPESWPVIGGPITLESLLYGLTGGLALISLLLAFAVFNLAVDQARLLRMAPAFVYQSGVVAAIAVAFVPQMAASWQSIREAQQVRGHRFRGVRDLLPLILPLLITALERAVQLAESMEARGFGGVQTAAAPRDRLAVQATVLVGLALAGLGLAGLGFWPQHRTPVLAVAALGLALLAWSFWRQGKRVSRTSYRRWYWGRGDRVVLVTGLLAASAWVTVLIARSEWLFYYPYPPYSPWPSFQPILGAAILLLAVPALLVRRPSQELMPIDPS